MNNIKSFLSFRLRDIIVAINVENVLNILELPKIKTQHGRPNYMLGSLNLRGTDINVIDLGILFGFKPADYTSKTSLLQIKIDTEESSHLFCFLVDDVLEVTEFDLESTKNQQLFEGISKIITKVIDKNDKEYQVLDLIDTFDNYELEYFSNVQIHRNIDDKVELIYDSSLEPEIIAKTLSSLSEIYYLKNGHRLKISDFAELVTSDSYKFIGA